MSKSNVYQFVGVLMIISIMGCGPEPIILPDENGQPSRFGVMIENVGVSDVTINWEKSEDPDGDIVSYSVYLGYSNKYNSDQPTSLTISGLDQETLYWGRVFAKDSKGGKTVTTFHFTTLKP
jgi:hypothetical protein